MRGCVVSVLGLMELEKGFPHASWCEGLSRVSGHGDKPCHVLDRCRGVTDKQ